MKTLKLVLIAVWALCATAATDAVAQQTIPSGAGDAFGDCRPTIYTQTHCPPCQELKQRLETNPKYICNSPHWISCDPSPDRDRDCNRIRTPYVIGRICDDCDRRGLPQGPPVTGTPGSPTSPCPDYKRCSDTFTVYPDPNPRPNSSRCEAGTVCVNEKDARGCKKDFECKAAPTATPEPETCGPEGCEPEECGPEGCPVEPELPPVTPVEPTTPPAPPSEPTPQPSPTPVPPSEPTAQPSPTPVPTGEPPVVPEQTAVAEPSPKAPTCDNPCGNAGGCCKPNEGCYNGQCTAYDGCRACRQGQVCLPTNTYPFYGCFDKK